MKRFFVILFFAILAVPENTTAQITDSIYKTNIKSVRLFKQGNQLTFPLINLNANDKLELHFDDLDADVKNYYYTYQLCDHDWSPANVMSMDYIQGFAQNRITTYRFSSVALTRYTHYTLVLPQQGSVPKKSGNYILKVYLNGDPSQLVFTKRMMIVNPVATVTGRVIQPTTPQYFKRFQKVAFNVNTQAMNNVIPQQQIKVVIMQNLRWDNAQMNVQPTFIRGNDLEYNSESIGIFPSGKEWRWLDLRDFHLQSDRVASADYNKKSTDIYLRTDRSWIAEPYMSYPDLNGMSSIEAVRGIDPYFEGDYATVYFSFYPDKGFEFQDKDLYLFGQLTDYKFNDSLKMEYNSVKGIYETKLLLKQGYYDYAYLTRDFRNPSESATLDGDAFETENVYTILVYYRPFGGRSDELVGVSTINSREERKGFGL